MFRRVGFILGCLAMSGMGWWVWRGVVERMEDPVVKVGGPREGVQEVRVEESDVSPGVAGLLAEEPLCLRDRLAFLSTLGHGLTGRERAMILDAVGGEVPAGLSEADWHTLANDMLEVLRDQRPAMPDYSDRVLALWRDRSLDPTLRDYALQHLREWVGDGDVRTVHEERPEKLGEIRDAFLAAVTPGGADCDPLSTTTGTALLALDEWTRDPSPEAVRVDVAKYESFLISHAENEQAHRGLRATALQLCARRRVMGALPLARRVVQEASEETIVRLAAISLLGAAGVVEDRELLEKLVKDSRSDPLLHGALVSALELMGTR